MVQSIEGLFGTLQQQLIGADCSSKHRKLLLTLLNDLWNAHNQLLRQNRLLCLDTSLMRQQRRKLLQITLANLAKNAGAAAGEKQQPQKQLQMATDEKAAVDEQQLQKQLQMATEEKAAVDVQLAELQAAVAQARQVAELERQVAPAEKAASTLRELPTSRRLTILNAVCGMGGTFRCIPSMQRRAVALWAARSRADQIRRIKREVARKCREILSAKLIGIAQGRWASHRWMMQRLQMLMHWKHVVAAARHSGMSKQVQLILFLQHSQAAARYLQIAQMSWQLGGCVRGWAANTAASHYADAARNAAEVRDLTVEAVLSDAAAAGAGQLSGMLQVCRELRLQELLCYVFSSDVQHRTECQLLQAVRVWHCSVQQASQEAVFDRKRRKHAMLWRLALFSRCWLQQRGRIQNCYSNWAQGTRQHVVAARAGKERTAKAIAKAEQAKETQLQQYRCAFLCYCRRVILAQLCLNEQMRVSCVCWAYNKAQAEQAAHYSAAFVSLTLLTSATLDQVHSTTLQRHCCASWRAAASREAQCTRNSELLWAHAKHASSMLASQHLNWLLVVCCRQWMSRAVEARLCDAHLVQYFKSRRIKLTFAFKAAAAVVRLDQRWMIQQLHWMMTLSCRQWQHNTAQASAISHQSLLVSRCRQLRSVDLLNHAQTAAVSVCVHYRAHQLLGCVAVWSARTYKARANSEFYTGNGVMKLVEQETVYIEEYRAAFLRHAQDAAGALTRQHLLCLLRLCCLVWMNNSREASRRQLSSTLCTIQNTLSTIRK